jgi:tRNA G18 (ribose-2'-O)-methylase SpoU
MKPHRQIVLIAHNLRSTHNIGSLLRTAEGLGIVKVFLTGYSPYPEQKNESRLPHLVAKMTKDIHKTALGAEVSLSWEHSDSIHPILEQLRKQGYKIWAVEQTPKSISLPTFNPPARCALLVGREVEGIEPEVLALCDGSVEIPMYGQKESFNVVQAAAMALYQCTFL